MTKREQILTALRDCGRTKSVDQWAEVFQTTRRYVQFVASRAGLVRPFRGRKHPAKILITYRPGKYGPRPGASVPCTALIAAGFNGQSKLSLKVERSNRRIVLELPV